MTVKAQKKLFVLKAFAYNIVQDVTVSNKIVFPQPETQSFQAQQWPAVTSTMMQTDLIFYLFQTENQLLAMTEILWRNIMQ